MESKISINYTYIVWKRFFGSVNKEEKVSPVRLCDSVLIFKMYPSIYIFVENYGGGYLHSTWYIIFVKFHEIANSISQLWKNKIKPNFSVLANWHNRCDDKYLFKTYLLPLPIEAYIAHSWCMIVQYMLMINICKGKQWSCNVHFYR